MIIILYVYGVRSRIRIEEEQAGREVFIESLLEKIKEPLRNIIKTSDKGGEEGRRPLPEIREPGLGGCAGQVVPVSGRAGYLCRVEETGYDATSFAGPKGRAAKEAGV